MEKLRHRNRFGDIRLVLDVFAFATNDDEQQNLVEIVAKLEPIVVKLKGTTLCGNKFQNLTWFGCHV